MNIDDIDDRLLFGLYSWKGDSPNLRNWELPKDPRDGTNQFNHIKDAGKIGKEVIEHLKSKCKPIPGSKVKYDHKYKFEYRDVEYYKNIDSLKFVPVDGTHDDAINTIQKMINLAYDVKHEAYTVNQQTSAQTQAPAPAQAHAQTHAQTQASAPAPAQDEWTTVPTKKKKL